MRILLVTHYYPPEFGAPQRRWQQLVREFRAAGHHVIVVTSPPHYPAGTLDPNLRRAYGPGTANWGEFGEYVIRTAYLPHRPDVVTRTADHLVAAADATRRILFRLGRADMRPDVVISTAPGIPSLFVGQAVSWLFGIPGIAEMRDAWPDLVTHMHVNSLAEEGKQNGIARCVHRLGALVKRVVHDGITRFQRLSTKVVTTTEGFAHVLEKRGVVAPVVIRNGVNLEQTAMVPPWQPHEGPLRVLYFGNKGRSQGLETLVEAAAIAQRRGTPLEVKIVGHGVAHDQLLELAEVLEAPVEVLDRVEAHRAREFYTWADTVVVSLKDWEPFEWTVPSKTYEILAVGRHITACVRGETARIVARSGAGDVIAPGDAKALADHFVRVVRYPELLDRRGLGRRWLVNKASMAFLSSSYLALLEEVVDRSRELPALGLTRSLVVRVARNVWVTAQVVARHLGEDPALFAVQVARRAPRGWGARAGAAVMNSCGRIPGGRGLAALGAFIAGDRARMSEAIAAAPGSNLAAEVAVLSDQFLPTAGARASTRARALWRSGALSEALAVLEGSHWPQDMALRARLASERRLLEPGMSLVNDELRGQAARVLAGWVPPGHSGTEHGGPERVLHVLTNSLPHTLSGYTMRSHAIVRAQQEAGMAVRAVTRVGYPLLVGKVLAKDVDLVDGVVYCRVLPWRLGSTMEERLRQQVLVLLTHVRTFNPTVLHTTTNYTNALVTRAVSELTGVPWVFEVRGLMEQTWAASKKTDAMRRAAIASEWYRCAAAREAELAQSAGAVVTLSHTMREELARRGVDARRVHIVPNSVNAELLTVRARPSKARRRLGLPADGFWVGAVSSLVDYEGFDTLICAVALARNAGHDVRILLAGDGVSRPELERVAEAEGIAEFCVFAGRVAKERARKYVLALDAVVIPRRDTPVTRHVPPLKPVEAMALGRPVIASDIPVLRELVTSVPCSFRGSDSAAPQAGVLVRPGQAQECADAIIRVMNDPELRAELLAAGNAIARARTWAAAVNTYSEVYKEARA